MEEIIRDHRVCPALGLLHDLADEEAEQAVLALREVLGLLGVGRDDRVDDLPERGLVARSGWTPRRSTIAAGASPVL